MPRYGCPVCAAELLHCGLKSVEDSDYINAPVRVSVYQCPQCSVKFEHWDITKYLGPKDERWFVWEQSETMKDLTPILLPEK